MWVSDLNDTKLYAYRFSNDGTNTFGSRDSGNDIDLTGDNDHPRGIWGGGGKIYVADDDDNKVYAYLLAPGESWHGDRSTSDEFNLASGNSDARGIWSDGATIWVADPGDDKLFAYKMSDKTHDSDKDITLHTTSSANTDASYIWSDAVTMWVLDSNDDEIYAYDMDSGDRDADRQVDLDGANANPNGMWSNGGVVWVPDWDDTKLYAYNIGREYAHLSVPRNNSWVGVACAGDDLYLGSDWSNRDRIWHYDQTDHSREHFVAQSLHRVLREGNPRHP